MTKCTCDPKPLKGHWSGCAAMSDRPEKWKGLDKLGAALMTAATLYGLHPEKGIRPFLRREFGPLLDAADHELFKATTKSHISQCPCGTCALLKQLEKFI